MKARAASRKSDRQNPKYYVVSKSGSQDSLGIYTNWLVCSKHVLNVSRAQYHGVESIEDAVRALEIAGITNPVVFHEGKTYSVDRYRKLQCAASQVTVSNTTSKTQDVKTVIPPENSMSKTMLQDKPLNIADPDETKAKTSVNTKDNHDTEEIKPKVSSTTSDIHQTMNTGISETDTEVLINCTDETSTREVRVADTSIDDITKEDILKSPQNLTSPSPKVNKIKKSVCNTKKKLPSALQYNLTENKLQSQITCLKGTVTKLQMQQEKDSKKFLSILGKLQDSVTN